MRILVADDEPEMTMVLEALLKRAHYSVDVVYNGQDALDYGLAENYDCIILDIMGPSWRRWGPMSALPPAGARGICWRKYHDSFTAPEVYPDRYGIAGWNNGR